MEEGLKTENVQIFFSACFVWLFQQCLYKRSTFWLWIFHQYLHRRSTFWLWIFQQYFYKKKTNFGAFNFPAIFIQEKYFWALNFPSIFIQEKYFGALNLSFSDRNHDGVLRTGEEVGSYIYLSFCHVFGPPAWQLLIQAGGHKMVRLTVTIFCRKSQTSVFNKQNEK